MIRIFIADDESPARDRLKELLGDIAAELQTQVVGEAANGLEAIERVPSSGAEVLLLDIQMPGMGGLEVARHLATLEHSPAVVFVTAHDRHAVEAFDLNALDYLMKPVRAERLAAAIRKASVPEKARLANAANAPREYLSVAERHRIALVPVRDIVFLRAEQKYVTVRTREREHLLEESLVALERELAERFVRIHRNCLVARAAIRGFERSGEDADEPRWQIVLDGIAGEPPSMAHPAQPAALKKLVIATRRSRLALWQAEHVKRRLEAAHAGLAVELLPMTTSGDEMLEARLDQAGGKGLFIKELEHAMAAGRADLAVHSMKDVPAELPPGFVLAAILEPAPRRTDHGAPSAARGAAAARQRRDAARQAGPR